MKRIWILAAALACLGACTSPSSTLQNDIAAVEVALTAAETAATAYVKLPACTGANAPVCADPKIVAQIKSADTQAYDAVQIAKAALSVASLAQAQAAVSALTKAIPAVPSPQANGKSA